MSEQPRPSVSVASFVARTAIFVFAFVLVTLTYGLTSGPWLAWLVGAFAVLADAAMSASGGTRGRPLLRSTALTAVIWIAAILVVTGPTLQFVAENAVYAGFALALATIGVVTLPRVQAIWAWILGTLLATIVVLNLSNGLASEPTATTLGVMALCLTAGSLGALGWYLRSAIASGRGWKHVASRVALIALAVGFSVAVSGFAATRVGLMEARNRGAERAASRQVIASRLAASLSTRFPEGEFASPTPALARELARLAALDDVGLSVYDTQLHRVPIAVRLTTRLKSTLPSSTLARDTGTEYVEIFDAVPVPATEQAAIRSAGEAPAVGLEGRAVRTANGAIPPFAVTLGVRDETARQTWQTAVATLTAAFEWQAVPDSRRFRLVVSESTPDWPEWDNRSAEEIGAEMGAMLAPWLFLAFLLPCSLGLLALDRRDAARTKLAAAEERTRLNRDAHDRVYNRLTALANRLAASQPPDADRPAPADEIRRTVADLQLILGDGAAPDREVNPDAAASLLADVCADAQRIWSMSVTLVGAEALLGIDPRTGWELVCIADEALTNAGRHGHAQGADVSVTRRAQSVTLVIADNGTGIESPLVDGLPANASGTRGMAQRAAALGGTLTIATTHNGTNVTAELPLST
jgi:signal transduction histidine kinase